MRSRRGGAGRALVMPLLPHIFPGHTLCKKECFTAHLKINTNNINLFRHENEECGDKWGAHTCAHKTYVKLWEIKKVLWHTAYQIRASQNMEWMNINKKRDREQDS